MIAAVLTGIRALSAAVEVWPFHGVCGWASIEDGQGYAGARGRQRREGREDKTCDKAEEHFQFQAVGIAYT